MKTNHIIIIAILLTLKQTMCFAQRGIDRDEPKFGILFGLNQPILLGGFNIEGNYWTKHLVLDYSHGFNLHLDGEFMGGDLESQHIDLSVTHSLGVGLGYRITSNFNLRLEPKFHQFEVYYDGEPQTESNRIESYSTFTLGLGAYYRWLPFIQREDGWRGLTIAPSIRYWPKVSSSLTDDQFSYDNKITDQTETLNASNIGVNNTPWIVNVSVGYTF